MEVISKNDKLNQVNKKMEDYRNAKVLVVWHILPDFKEVHVYHGTRMRIYKGKEIIAAAPVLPDFKISVEGIFA
ncbi:MAG: Uma2 family endonuclease [Bacteroidota bacterium]